MSKRKILSIILVFYIWCVNVWVWFDGCHGDLFACSWTVNVVDGILLIVAHAINMQSQGNARFYKHLYDSKYIYGIWMLEVGGCNGDHFSHHPSYPPPPPSPQAILNPLQGFFNAMAYGGVCHSFCGWLGRKLRPSEDPYVSSWSGEYIDVDFRVNRGKIHQSKRSQAKNSTPSGDVK